MTARRLIFLRLALLAGATLTPASLAAADTPAPAPAPAVAPSGDIIYPRAPGSAAVGGGPATGSSASTGLLVTALALAAAGGWLYWRGRRLPGGAIPTRHLAIAETKSLGNRQYLVVASYQDKKFLLGVCPGRIDMLTPLDGPVEPKKT